MVETIFQENHDILIIFETAYVCVMICVQSDNKCLFFKNVKTSKFESFLKKEILEMIKISSQKKYNDCYISLYYNITIVIFKLYGKQQ